MPRTPPAIRLKKVCFRYERQGPDVLKELSFEVPKGRITGIMGGNGTGKSTLLKLIGGALKPYSGKIACSGRASVLVQDPQLLFSKDRAGDELKDEALIDRFELGGLLNSHPYHLSGGEQQRLAIAMAMAVRPDILALDEPTKGMDALFKAKFAGILKDFAGAGGTVLIVSHDVEFLAAYADKCALIFDGAVVSSGRPREFFSGNNFYTTAASRMSRHVFKNAVTAEDVIWLLRENGMA